MYICPKCNKQSQPGEGQHSLILQTRPTFYKNTKKVPRGKKGHRKEEIVSTGWEIVKEIKVCGECHGRQNNNQ